MYTKRFRTLFRLSIPVCLLLTVLPALTVRSAPAVLAAAAPAAIAVTTDDDEYGGGINCSLREAIQSANDGSNFGGCTGAKASANVITLPAGAYTLGGAAGEDGNASGDLDITGTLTINGASEKTTFIQAGTNTSNGVDRVLHVHSGATVEINGVTIRYGKTADGTSGASGSNGDPGGGIYNDSATLILNDCDVSYNRTGDGGDGPSFGRSGGPGGGIASYAGTLILNDTIVSNNETGAGGDGSTQGGQGGSGGGIHLSSSGVMTLTNSVVSSNAAGDGGRGGADGLGGYGGGLYVYDNSHAALHDSTMHANTAYAGGGMYSEIGAIVALANCTLSGNIADGGCGGVNNGPLATLSLTNSTVSGNRAYGSGGGVCNSGEATLTHVTIADNTADWDDDGSGGGGGFIVYGGTVAMTNTIVAKNIDRGGEEPDYNGYAASGDYNLLGICDSPNCFLASQANDLVGTTASPIDPLLGVLGGNGGPTWTHPLNPGSPAIDQIPAGVNGCSAGEYDQRGELRVPPCDIGAYEAYLEFVYLPLVVKD